MPVHSLLKVCRKLSRNKNSAGRNTIIITVVKKFKTDSTESCGGKLTSVYVLEAVDQAGDLFRQLLLQKKSKTAFNIKSSRREVVDFDLDSE